MSNVLKGFLFAVALAVPAGFIGCGSDSDSECDAVCAKAIDECGLGALGLTKSQCATACKEQGSMGCTASDSCEKIVMCGGGSGGGSN